MAAELTQCRSRGRPLPAQPLVARRADRLGIMSQRWKPNVTVAAIVERRVGALRQFLLVEEETPEGLMLNNPAGHLDPGESPQQAVIREAMEETGCVFRPQFLVGVYLSRQQRPARGEDTTYLRFAFGGSAGEPEPGAALDAGIVRTLWLTHDELRASRARHRSALVLRCIEDQLAGQRFPLELITVDATLYTPALKSGR